MKKLLSIIMCGLIVNGTLLLASGCGSHSPGDVPKPGEDILTSDILETRETPDSSVASGSVSLNCDEGLQEKVGKHITDFSTQLFKVSFKNNENTLVSPFSVYTLFSLISNGAESDSEIIDTLSGYYQIINGAMVCYVDYNPLTHDELNAYFNNYMNNLEGTDNAQMVMANSVWLNEGTDVKFNKDFLSLSENSYHAEMFNRKFDNSVIKKINKWVDKNTNGMIKEIISDMSPNAIMYLVNTLAFDGKWETEYKQEDIIDHTFNNSDGSKIETKFMNSTEESYITTDKAVGFIKNYEGGNYSFIALLPDEEINIEEYINTYLSADTFTDAVQNPESATVYAKLPKFEAQTTVDLTTDLPKLGIVNSFDPMMADFRKMFECTKQDENVYISQAIHKTYISVSEQGTKAAAATTVEFAKNDVALAPEENCFYVTLDRPFVYAIYDNNAQIPAFIGVVTNL